MSAQPDETFGEAFYLGRTTVWGRLRRNLRLLRYLVGIGWWWWRGRRIRSSFRRTMSAGETFLVDGEAQ